MTSPSQPLATGLSYEDVQRIVSEQLAQRDAQHAEEIKALKDQLDAMTAAMATRGVVSLVPAHGAGPGIEVAETWSQWEQEISRTGLGMHIVDYVKKLEGIDSGNVLQRVQRLETQLADSGEIKRLLEELASAAHTHKENGK